MKSETSYGGFIFFVFFFFFFRFFQKMSSMNLSERLYDRCGMCGIAHVNKTGTNPEWIFCWAGGLIGFFFRVIAVMTK
jgi:hypothetical protein